MAQVTSGTFSIGESSCRIAITRYLADEPEPSQRSSFKTQIRVVPRLLLGGVIKPSGTIFCQAASSIELT